MTKRKKPDKLKQLKVDEPVIPILIRLPESLYHKLRAYAIGRDWSINRATAEILRRKRFDKGEKDADSDEGRDNYIGKDQPVGSG